MSISLKSNFPRDPDDEVNVSSAFLRSAGEAHTRCPPPKLSETGDERIDEQSDDKKPPAKPARQNQWFVNETFDALFVCGLAPWLAGIVMYVFFGNIDLAPVADPPLSAHGGFPPPTPGVAPTSMQQALNIAFVVSALLIGESHQFTSIIRYFTKYRPKKRSWFSRIPFLTMYLGLVTVAIVLLGTSLNITTPKMFEPLIGAWFSLAGTIASAAFVLFPVVLMQHICGQARAVGLIYCAKQGYKLSPWELRAVSVQTWIFALTGAVTIAKPFLDLVDQLAVLNNFSSLMQSLALLGASILTARFVARGIAEKDWLPCGAAVLWLNLALWLLLPFSWTLFVWLCVPLLFHATQHWCVAWSTKLAETGLAAKKLSTLTALLEFFRMALPIQAVTLLVLFLPIVFAGSNSFFADSSGKTLNVGWSILVFYFHYFSDRLVWKPQ